MRDLRGTATAVVGAVGVTVPMFAASGHFDNPLLGDTNAIRIIMGIPTKGDLTWIGLAIVVLGFCLFSGGALKAIEEWPEL